MPASRQLFVPVDIFRIVGAPTFLRPDRRTIAFPEQGSLLEEGCLARVRLPDYEIARLRTGQFRPGSAPLWSVEAQWDSAPPGE